MDRLNRKAIFYSRSWSAARARTFQTIRITHNYAAWGSKIDYETLYLYLYEKTASDPITRLVSTQNIEILRNFALALTTEDYDPEVYELLVKRLSDLGCVFDSRQSIDWEVLNLDEPYLLVAWCMIIAKKGNASWSHYTRTGNAAIWPQQVEVGSRALVLFSRPLPETEDPYEVQQYLDR